MNPNETKSNAYRARKVGNEWILLPVIALCFCHCYCYLLGFCLCVYIVHVHTICVYMWSLYYIRMCLALEVSRRVASLRIFYHTFYTGKARARVRASERKSQVNIVIRRIWNEFWCDNPMLLHQPNQAKPNRRKESETNDSYITVNSRFFECSSSHMHNSNWVKFMAFV